MGGDAVGEVTKSLTTHVFYVNQNVSAQFEAALAIIAPADGIEKVPAEATTDGENDAGTEEP